MTRSRKGTMLGRSARIKRTVVIMAAAAGSAVNANELGNAMRIQISAPGGTAIAVLDDNTAARDFLALLPLKLVLEDYAATEKISDLPRRLSTDGAPAGIRPSAGDITFYAPWGNLAIFHKTFRYSEGLVKLGRIESGLDAIEAPARVPVTFERLKD